MASAGLNLDWNDSPDISNSQFDPVTVCALGDILSENIIHDMGALDQENGITALVMRVIHSLIFLVNLLAARLNRSVQDTFASEQVAKATATAEALAKENEDLRAKVSDLVVRADEADAHVKALQDKGECLTECYIQQMENLRSIQKQYFDSCREDSRLLDQDGDPLSNIGDENDTDNTEAKEYFFFSEETGKTNNAGGKKKPKKKSGKKPGGTRTTRKKPKESTDTGSDEDVADKRGRASKSDAGSGLGNQDTSGTAGNNEDPSATKHKDRNYKTRTPGDQAEAVKKIEKHVYVLKLPNGKVLEQDEPFDIEVIRKMKLVSPFGSPVKILELEESHHEIHHIEYFECRHYMRLDYSQKEPLTTDASKGVTVSPSEAPLDGASGAVEGTTMPSEATPDAASGAVEGTTMPSETTPDGASGAVEGTTMPSETTPDASSGAVEGTTMPSEVTPDGASGAVEGTTMPSETVSDASSGAVEGTTMPSEATPAGASGAVEGTTMPSETVSDAASVADEETTAHTETAPNSSATHTVRHSIFAKLPFIKNSPLSSSLLAWIISLRFCLCASGYKILDAIHRKGYDCSDGTPYNWFHLGARMLRPLKDRLCYLIKQEKRLHCDESPGDVHGEEGRANSTKSYFWFLTTIEEAAHKICVVFYCPGRGGVFPADFLRGFIGKLITDAYQAYNYVPYCIRCLCNSHSRRNFFTAAICGITHLRRSKAKDIVALFDKIFEYERSFKGKTPAEKEILRQELVKPLMDEIGRLCREIQSDPRLYAGKLKKAVFYFLHNEQGLRRFLDDGLIPASNNLAERMVKPFALLRSVSLFWASPTGADDCSVLMTVVRTAELNGLDVEPYLEYVFTRISETPENMRDDVFYDSLLPFSADMQQRFRLSERKERT